MFMTKIKSVLAMVLVVGLTLGGAGVGVGLFNNQVAVAQPGPVQPPDPAGKNLSATDKASGITVELAKADLTATDAKKAVLWKAKDFMKNRGEAKSLTIRDGDVHLQNTNGGVFRVELKTGKIIAP